MPRVQVVLTSEQYSAICDMVKSQINDVKAVLKQVPDLKLLTIAKQELDELKQTLKALDQFDRVE